jgi:hypothetical protein
MHYHVGHSGVVMVVKWVVLPVLVIAMCGWELLKGGPMMLVLGDERQQLSSKSVLMMKLLC